MIAVIVVITRSHGGYKGDVATIRRRQELFFRALKGNESNSQTCVNRFESS